MTKAQKKNRTKKKKEIPGWGPAPFHQFLDDAERLSHVMHLSVMGISMLPDRPRLLEALMKLDKDSSKSKKVQLENANKEADLAQREVDSGFHVLYAWGIVALWAHLESLIRVVVESWLKNKRSSWQVEPIQRLRIKLGEYHSIPAEQKHEFVAELLERELCAGLKSGVTRFEKLLEPFGLSGDVPAILRRTIYEFGQVRNLVAHRASTVDLQFVHACPWLDVRIGTDLYVSEEMFRKFHYAAGAYVTLLVCRVGEKSRIDMSEHRISTEGEIERILSNKTFEATS